MHRNNSFIRRYPHHPVNQEKTFDLGHNSYYIAGVTNDSIYLGNVTAPLLLFSMDKNLNGYKRSKIKISNPNEYSFRSIGIHIVKDKLFVYDGHVPVILMGDLSTRKVSPLVRGHAYFTNLEVVDTTTFALRINTAGTGETELALLKVGDSIDLVIHPELLTKQIDGVFDSDGFLMYDRASKSIVYVYRYRNEYIVTNRSLTLGNRGNLIDTISKADIEIARVKATNQTKLGPKSTVVTKNAESYGPFLFAQSDRLGKYESEKMLDQASIIDVYRILDQTYAFSFYLYNYKDAKLRQFKVDNDQVFALMGKYLVSLKMNPNYFDPKEFQSISADIRGKTENLN